MSNELMSEQEMIDTIKREYVKTWPNIIFGLSDHIRRLKIELGENVAERDALRAVCLAALADCKRMGAYEITKNTHLDMQAAVSRKKG